MGCSSSSISKHTKYSSQAGKTVDLKGEVLTSMDSTTTKITATIITPQEVSSNEVVQKGDEVDGNFSEYSHASSQSTKDQLQTNTDTIVNVAIDIANDTKILHDKTLNSSCDKVSSKITHLKAGSALGSSEEKFVRELCPSDFQPDIAESRDLDTDNDHVSEEKYDSIPPTNNLAGNAGNQTVGNTQPLTKDDERVPTNGPNEDVTAEEAVQNLGSEAATFITSPDMPIGNANTDQKESKTEANLLISPEKLTKPLSQATASEEDLLMKGLIKISESGTVVALAPHIAPEPRTTTLSENTEKSAAVRLQERIRERLSRTKQPLDTTASERSDILTASQSSEISEFSRKKPPTLFLSNSYDLDIDLSSEISSHAIPAPLSGSSEGRQPSPVTFTNCSKSPSESDPGKLSKSGSQDRSSPYNGSVDINDNVVQFYVNQAKKQLSTAESPVGTPVTLTDKLQSIEESMSMTGVSGSPPPPREKGTLSIAERLAARINARRESGNSVVPPLPPSAEVISTTSTVKKTRPVSGSAVRISSKQETEPGSTPRQSLLDVSIVTSSDTRPVRPLSGSAVRPPSDRMLVESKRPFSGPHLSDDVPEEFRVLGEAAGDNVSQAEDPPQDAAAGSQETMVVGKVLSSSSRGNQGAGAVESKRPTSAVSRSRPSSGVSGQRRTGPVRPSGSAGPSRRSSVSSAVPRPAGSAGPGRRSTLNTQQGEPQVSTNAEGESVDAGALAEEEVMKDRERPSKLPKSVSSERDENSAKTVLYRRASEQTAQSRGGKTAKWSPQSRHASDLPVPSRNTAAGPKPGPLTGVIVSSGGRSSDGLAAKTVSTGGLSNRTKSVPTTVSDKLTDRSTTSVSTSELQDVSVSVSGPLQKRSSVMRNRSSTVSSDSSSAHVKKGVIADREKPRFR